MNALLIGTWRGMFLMLAAFSFFATSVSAQEILGEAYLEAGDAARSHHDLSKAARFYHLALVEAHGQQHPKLTAGALLGAAAIHVDLGELDQAEENVRAALSICDQIPTLPHQLQTKGLNLMAMIDYHRGDYEQSEAFYTKLLTLIPDDGGNILERVLVMNDLALVKIALKAPNDALPLAIAAADDVLAHAGSESTRYAMCLDTLGRVLRAGHHLDEARHCSVQALDILAEHLGQHSPQYGAAMVTLSVIEHDLGNHVESARLAEVATQIQDATRGPAHPSTHHARETHTAILQHSNSLHSQDPTIAEVQMFEEIYGGKSLDDEQLSAIYDHWISMPNSARVKVWESARVNSGNSVMQTAKSADGAEDHSSSTNVQQ